ncbi:MAG: bile acid:sodium symporter [Bacteroidales bacterium]|nr:bile acid:sodium symporter [Bacteroidales bacterium]
MSRLVTFLKNWALPVSMVAGVAAYFIFAALHLPPAAHVAANKLVGFLQPALLFCMLFLSFSKIDPKTVRFRPWHLWMLLIQGGTYLLMVLLLVLTDFSESVDILIESFMLCMICPTATAAVVVTDKLGGDMASTVTYTMLINVLTAFLISISVPLLNPDTTMSFGQALGTMMGKVFSVLVLPLILAVLVRYLMPKVNKLVCKPKDLAFYLWTICLALALTLTTRSLVHTDIAWYYIVGIGVISALTCVLQFVLGHRIGERYSDRVTAGQSFGQKNTMFLIWVAYTFMNPVTSLAGGLYSIWHNLYNSWQLYKEREK